MEIMDHGEELIITCMLTVINPNGKFPSSNLNVSGGS